MSAAVVVFLFCLASFGVIVILGGGSVTTIEVEIWVRATRQFDISGAAVLAVIQVVTVVAALALHAHFARRAPVVSGARRVPATTATRWVRVVRRRVRLGGRVGGRRPAARRPGRALAARPRAVTDSSTGPTSGRSPPERACRSRPLACRADLARHRDDRGRDRGRGGGPGGIGGRPPSRRTGRPGAAVAARGVGHDDRARSAAPRRPTAASTCEARGGWCRSARRWSRCRWSSGSSLRRSHRSRSRFPRRRRCSERRPATAGGGWISRWPAPPSAQVPASRCVACLGEFGATAFLTRSDRVTVPGGDRTAHVPARIRRFRSGHGAQLHPRAALRRSRRTDRPPRSRRRLPPRILTSSGLRQPPIAPLTPAGHALVNFPTRSVHSGAR